MQKLLDQGNQYYPTDNSGVIDEWAALALQQDSFWKQRMQQDKLNKKVIQQQYFQDLENQRRPKGSRIFECSSN
jgi:tRNA G46 methylase TrmB